MQLQDKAALPIYWFKGKEVRCLEQTRAGKFKVEYVDTGEIEYLEDYILFAVLKEKRSSRLNIQMSNSSYSFPYRLDGRVIKCTNCRMLENGTLEFEAQDYQTGQREWHAWSARSRLKSLNEEGWFDFRYDRKRSWLKRFLFYPLF